MTVNQADILSDGFVRLYRQRIDLPFTPDNILNIETPFDAIDKLYSAFSSVMSEESACAAMHPFAWNPEFGYVTARPELCGTCLEISALFHLEGLNLIGDLDPTLNALTGLRMDIRGCCGGGLKDAAHLFHIANLRHLGIEERDLMTRVARVFSDLIQQETNARIRLVDEVPRVFEDAIARSLAILRSCRLISEWELLDIISPLRLAAEFSFLDHFSQEEAQTLTRSRLNMVEQPAPNTLDEQRERDRRDAALADKVNKRFKNVRLNARGKDYLS